MVFTKAKIQSMKHIKIGITQGDINSTNYEIIMKVLSEPRIFDGKTIVVYGSPKAAAYHRKSIDLQNFNFNLVNSAEEAAPKRPNIINCIAEDVRVDAGMSTNEAGKAAMVAMKAAVADLKRGAIDVLVAMPVNKDNIRGAGFEFDNNTSFLAKEFGTTQQMELLVSESFKTCYVSKCSQVSQISKSITKDAVLEKIVALNDSLRADFCVTKPRIAVLALNGEMGEEEKNAIVPAIEEAKANGFVCVGPYSAEQFFAQGEFKKYDGTVGMYREQIAVPFKALSYDGSLSYTVGLPKLCVSPAVSVDYASVDKNSADESSLSQAIFSVGDIMAKQEQYAELIKNQLK